MKILSIGSMLTELKRPEPFEGSGKEPPPACAKNLVISWTCDVCSYGTTKTIPHRQAYTDIDVKEIVKSVFSFAFYECMCPGIAAKKKTNGKILEEGKEDKKVLVVDGSKE